jgi:predicted nuclease of predicted toxin-antitoxin system
MKVLLDENLPHDFRPLLMPMHDVYTVAYLGWSGLENGDLLSAAAAQLFDLIVTLDSGVEHEQNLANLPIAVVILDAASNKIDDLRPLLPRLLHAMEALQPKTLIRVS